MSEIIRKRAQIPGLNISDYVLRLPKKPRRLILLLHGFTESGEIIFKRLAEQFNEEDAILAPNAPFPLPEKKEDHYKIGFAWYFYDNLKNEYFIDFKLATTMLKSLLQELQLDHLPKVIIGYSQGGYLAPFASEVLSQVNCIIGLACVFRQDLMLKLPNCPIYGIHGDCDPLVEPKRAQQFHQDLIKRGAHGDFLLLEGEGHRLTHRFKLEIAKILNLPKS